MNIIYPDSSDYTNLANLWLQAANEADQKIETKQNLLNRTTELISRIENVDRSIPHEEVSHICDRVLGEFNRLSDENQDSIANFAATLGDTGYEYLHKLFQTIGDTQHLPNYFDPQPPPDPPRNLFDGVIDRSITLFKSFTEKKPPPAEGITNLGIKVKEQSIALSNKSSIDLLTLFEAERGLQEQIFSNLDKPSKIAFESTSKLNHKYRQQKQQQDIVKGLNERARFNEMYLQRSLGIDSNEALIRFLGTENCKQVTHFETYYVSESGTSKDIVDNIRQAFPNLATLHIIKPHDDALKGQKGFELLKELRLSEGNFEQLDASSFTHISTLKIECFPKLTTIKDFTSLSVLIIRKCPKLDINLLKDIPSLKEVCIYGIADYNLSGLANNPYVSELIFFGPSSQNFDFLLEMPALKQLWCSKRLWVPDVITEKLLQKGVKVDIMSLY